MDARSSSFTTFVLRVDTQTPGWEQTMIKILKGIPGATFKIDANGLARVSGYIDPATTLKLIAKAGKHAEMYWIDSGSGRTTQPSEKRDYYHHLDDPHGRYLQTNNHHYHQPSEKRDYYHHLDDPHGRYLQTNNHQYHQRPLPLPPPPPPPQYLTPYPPSAPEYYGGEASQCMIM